MKSPELRWFLLTFGIVAGLSLLVSPTPDDRGSSYVTVVIPPAAFVYFLLLIVPGVSVVASVASAWVGRGQVRPWLAAYAGIVAGTVPWSVWGALTGVLTADVETLVLGIMAFGLLFAGVPYLVVGLPTLVLRRWAPGSQSWSARP